MSRRTPRCRDGAHALASMSSRSWSCIADFTIYLARHAAPRSARSIHAIATRARRASSPPPASAIATRVRGRGVVCSTSSTTSSASTCAAWALHDAGGAEAAAEPEAVEAEAAQLADDRLAVVRKRHEPRPLAAAGLDGARRAKVAKLWQQLEDVLAHAEPRRARHGVVAVRVGEEPVAAEEQLVVVGLAALLAVQLAAAALAAAVVRALGGHLVVAAVALGREARAALHVEDHLAQRVGLGRQRGDHALHRHAGHVHADRGLADHAPAASTTCSEQAVAVARRAS